MNRLLALAVLAEDAAVRAFPIRWFVLVLLAHAEAVARSFVAEEVGDAWPRLQDDGDLGCDALDAVHLAGRFRLLAAILGALIDAGVRADFAASNGLWLDAILACPSLPSHLLLVIVARGVRLHPDTS